MADSTSDDHEKRVRDAFDSLHKNVGDRMDDDARRSVEGLRTAAASRDREQLRSGITDVQQRHGWLYRELAEHPDVSNLLNELALWGF
ncbi:MAG: hypothetical protein M3S32_04615 [Acidobacteriota bacterium]|nr:hypothetical protein [Acidobacteriota bacterium]